MPLRFPILFLFVFWAFQAFSQNAQQLKQKGKIEFERADYPSAIKHFESAKKLNPNDSEIQYFLGISYYHNESPDLAKTELLPLSKLKRIPDEKLFFYLGKACHSEHEFTKAVQFYKEFLKRYDKNDRLRNEVKEDILRCAVGLRRIQNRDKVVVENLGEVVNSEFDDFAPIVSPNDANKLYFTSNRLAIVSNMDMFSSQIQDGKYSMPASLKNAFKSLSDDILLGFDETGEKMFMVRGDYHHFTGTYILITQTDSPTFFEFEDPVNFEKGDYSPHFFSENIIIFARRDEIFGDYELVISNFKNGNWSEPKDIGKSVNSQFNEVSPFLTNDTKTLYFSSDNPRKSMGGYDIFKSEFDEKTQTWSEPENLNYPINSAGNEEHFRISKDGYSAYFSSDRKSGFGGKDIYSVHFSSSKNETSEKTENQISKPQSQKLPGLFYQIEIRETNSERLEKLQSKFPNPTIEKPPNSDTFHLLFGQYRTFQSANLLRWDLVRTGYLDIKINAFVDGKKIGKSEAEKLVSKYPDLRFFFK